MTQPDYYAFLGVARDASAEQINKAFRERALVLHPDKNKTDPDAAKKFKYLTQAYQVLTDPPRRTKYDATLPPPPTEPQVITGPAPLWQAAEKLFLEQSARYTPAVDAMRVSHPLTIENDNLLIVGIDPVRSSLTGYLDTGVTHNHVRKILTELYGRPLDFRIIKGTTLEEWETLKNAEERLRSRRAGGRSAITTPPAGDTSGGGNDSALWDELMESLSRQWSAVETRGLPQARARYIVEQLPSLARTEDQARAAGAADDTLQRNLARALERLASLSGMESAVVALEYLRYRARMLGGI
ncbi:MAG TPA: J domain-containing protein [Armatimonadota bacterium]|jgi:hypothetical protein